MKNARTTLGLVLAAVAAVVVWWVQGDSAVDRSAGTDQESGTFGEFEGILTDEQRGYYREYTVATPGVSRRGARRIVTGSAGEHYWTEDHHGSFERIAR